MELNPTSARCIFQQPLEDPTLGTAISPRLDLLTLPMASSTDSQPALCHITPLLSAFHKQQKGAMTISVPPVYRGQIVCSQLALAMALSCHRMPKGSYPARAVLFNRPICLMRRTLTATLTRLQGPSQSEADRVSEVCSLPIYHSP